MKKIFLTLPLLAIGFTACSQQKQNKRSDLMLSKAPKIEKPVQDTVLTLDDFLSDNPYLDQKVEEYFSKLDDTSRVAQTLMPAMGRLGYSTPTIFRLVRQRKIGGILMLNGSKQQFTQWIDSINAINKELGVPGFLYSADAEPSLFNRKITGTKIVKKANEVKSIEEVKQVADTIASELNEIGINYDFAPVVDMSKNATVGYRGFGLKPEHIVPWSDEFIQQMQDNGIIATAKHFPGHGLVSGDSHKSLQTIDGELKEIHNYPQLIKDGVLSIMIGHLAVINNPKYNTNDLPATLSPVIVTKLLRGEFGFKGIVITDAMNMGGVASVPNCEEKAIAAGCDIALMPVNTDKAFKDIYTRYHKDATYKDRVDDAAKRVIRMKFCLGILK